MRVILFLSLLLAVSVFGGAEATHADPGITSPSAASALAAAMDVPSGDIVSASLGTSDPLGTGVADAPLSFFPTSGSTFAILPSGLASSADDPDTNNDECLGCGGAGDDVTYVLDGLNNSQGNDIVQLSLTLSVPEPFGCLAFDFAFYSEEFPDFINSAFNDTFIAEVGPPGSASTFTIEGNDVIAPNNIAFDTNNETLDVNSAFGFDPANPNPDTGTTYDGSSGLLATRTQVTPGTQVEIVFSIMDLGDSILDSAVFLDNFRWTTDPPELCQPGAQPVPSLNILFIQGIGSQRRCGHPEDFEGRVNWLSTALSLRVPGVDAGDFAYYEYTSAYPDDPTCTGDYARLDSCWSLDDVYTRAFWQRTVPGGGQAERLASYLRSYLDSHPGSDLSIVTHSQGGVVAAYTVKEKLSQTYRNRIRAIVTLDSPLGGINRLGPGALRSVAGCANNDLRLDSSFDMKIRSAVITRINDTETPSTRLYTINAVPGYFACLGEDVRVCLRRVTAADDSHSRSSWDTDHISAAAFTHSDVWNGCFLDSGTTYCPGTGADSERTRVARFVACAVGDLAVDCSDYADQAE